MSDAMTDRSQEFREIKFDGKKRTIRPLLDVGRLKLPEGIELCGLCQGHAQLMQHWCDAPPSPGACDMCQGGQFVYRATGKPIPRSVSTQIETTNPDLIRDDGTWTAYRVCTDYGGRLFHRAHENG